jgi:protein ImuB
MAKSHRKPFPIDGDLFPPSPALQVPARLQPAEVAAPGTQRLWLCLYIPDLPLEVFTAAMEGPRGILSSEGRQATVLFCDSSAAGLGVRPGMSINAALALAPDLQFEQRNLRLEREVLAHLAAWALRFTPTVSIDPGNALLLEVASSLKLFGGLDGLRSAVGHGVRKRGYAVMMGGAPTARAARWLARAGSETIITDVGRLPAVLATLPLNCLEWPDKVQGVLQRMGVRCLGECLRLPRDGLARRIGVDLLRELDEGLGRRPEARESYCPPECFHDLLELPAETNDSGPVRAALQVLLARLRSHLVARQAAARILWIRLQHRTASDSWLRIGLLAPSADIGHLQELASLQLSVKPMPAPVLAVGLEVDAVSLQPVTEGLLHDGPDRSRLLASLLERLRVRLGVQSVHGLGTAPGHRPERTWHVVPEPDSRPESATHAFSFGQRPLWLLEHPVLLKCASKQPFFAGRLESDAGPERIESGWWDGHDVRRDYYLMHNAQGARFWVFRDRRGGAWYLHGIFG